MNSAALLVSFPMHTCILEEARIQKSCRCGLEIFRRLIVLEGFVTWNKFWCCPSSVSVRRERITAAAFFWLSLLLAVLLCIADMCSLLPGERERDKEVLVLILGCNAGKLWPDNWFDVNHRGRLENQPVGFSPLDKINHSLIFLVVAACVCVRFFSIFEPLSGQRNCLVREMRGGLSAKRLIVPSISVCSFPFRRILPKEDREFCDEILPWRKEFVWSYLQINFNLLTKAHEIWGEKLIRGDMWMMCGIKGFIISMRLEFVYQFQVFPRDGHWIMSHGCKVK